MAEKKSFVMYKSWSPLVEPMDDAQAGKLLKAIFAYQRTGEEPPKDAAYFPMFNLFKEKFSEDQEAYDSECERNRANGRKGGRPKKTEDNQNKPTETQNNPVGFSETHNNPQKPDKDKDNDKDNDNTKKERDKYSLVEQEQIAEVVAHLNERCGTNYKPTTKDTAEHIHARLAEGYTVDDLKSVIDKKARDWVGSEWEKYLRPKTLFIPANFENYINQPDRNKTGREGIDAFLRGGADDG